MTSLNNCIQAMLIVGSVLLTSACSPVPDCDRTIRDETASADGRMKAAIADVQCGATTADASWILLTSATHAFDAYRDRVAVFEGHVDGLHWEIGQLVVSSSNAKAIQTPASAAGVAITYSNAAGT